MKSKLCDVNPATLEKLPERTGDKSGIGVHYVDAYLKSLDARTPAPQVASARPLAS